MSSAERLAQLKAAEDLLAQDASHYPAIFPVVLQLTTQQDVPTRRWITAFLTRTFSPRSSLAATGKEALLELNNGAALDALSALLEGNADAGVVKSTVLSSSLIYPILFQKICKSPPSSSAESSLLWSKLTQVKSAIVQIWDQSANQGVRIACVKFIEKVIATQTPGIKDPRLADKSDISSTIVPLNHPIIHIPALEAESQGFLDRLLSVLQDKPIDPILAMSVINALGPLVKTRHTISTKIINGLLKVDLASIPQSTTDPTKAQLQLRSLSKTIRIHLYHFLKNNAAGSLAKTIEQYLRTSQVNGLLYDGEDLARKRGAEDDVGSQPPVKRVRTGAPIDPVVALAFLLDPANPLALYDANTLPAALVTEIVIRTLEFLPPQLLEDRLNLVRARLLAVPAGPVPMEDVNGDYDDYDPEAITLDPHPTTADDDEGDGAQIHPDLDSLALSSFELPHPERLSPTRLKSEFQASVERILQSLRSLEGSSVQRAGLPTGKMPGLESLAIVEWDKEAWMVLLTRLSARALSGPSRGDEGPLPNLLRERVFEYIMSNFREHMDLIIAWLTEEWYNDKLVSQENAGTKGEGVYGKWAMRILDNILPFIETKDSKIFLRFLGDLPLLTEGMVAKLGVLCLDPERIKLGFAGIKYLLLLRPPVRADCIDLLVDLYKNHADTKKMAADVLNRWAPDRLEG